MSSFIDLTGNRYGRLVVVNRAENKLGKNGRTRTMWNCVCDCGNAVIVEASHLKSGHSKSCGCITKKHGMFGTRIYKIWDSMKQRCFNKNHSEYKNYGGRGITICDEWIQNFQSFYNWAMANGYRDDLTIDRKDVNGNYCPENCRWADDIVQHNNTRVNRYIEFKGETHTMAEWARIKGMKYVTLNTRINKYQWSIEKALTTPVEIHNKK